MCTAISHSIVVRVLFSDNSWCNRKLLRQIVGNSAQLRDRQEDTVENTIFLYL